MRKNLTQKLLPVLILLLAVFSVTVWGEAGETTSYRVTKTYSYESGNALVSIENTLLKDLNEVDEIYGVDFVFEGENVTFQLPYENIYRDTTKFLDFDSDGNVVAYHDFSAKVTLFPLSSAPSIPSSLAEKEGLYLDFEDGETYPGLMHTTVRLDNDSVGKTYSLYAVCSSEDSFTLTPILEHYTVPASNSITFDTTEAHDYVLTNAASDSKDMAALILPVTVGKTGGLAWYYILLITVGTLGLCALIAFVAIRMTAPAFYKEKKKHKKQSASSRSEKK